MEFLTPERIKRMYVRSDILLRRTFINCNFVLKYDYTTDKQIEWIETILNSHNKNPRCLIDKNVNVPFKNLFFEIIDEFGNKDLSILLNDFYSNTKIIRDKTKSIEDLRAVVGTDSNNHLICYVDGPDLEQDTMILYSSYAHELIHLPQLLRKHNYEYYEYSEALSMFFEYLTYNKISNGNGLELYLNNRVKQLYDTHFDHVEDLYYAKNNHDINASRSLFSLLLASAMSYYEGFELSLDLIEYSKKNKKKMGEILYKILSNQSTIRDEAENLGIDPSSCSKTLKLINY